MKLLFIGGDRRMQNAAENMHEFGYEVSTYGLSPISGDLICEEICVADAVILPLPITKDNLTVTAPLTNELIYIDDILNCSPKHIYGGIISKALSETLNAKKIKHFDYYTNEPLTVKNAILTAEAAISIAIKESDISLFKANALVIGYGRIGKQLSSYLKALGANVTATSRNDGTCAVIEADGYNSKITQKVKSELDKFHFIFNTVPVPIMDRTFFSRCKENCLVLDLATNADNDFTAAKEYKINAGPYPGLPGKFFPISAGRIIAETIHSHITNQNIV